MVVVTFYLLNPGCGSGDLLEVELLGVDNPVEVYVTVVALDDIGLRLDGADDLTDLRQFLLTHLGSFVQQDDVTELYLLDDQILNVVLIDVGTQQVVTATELVAHPEGIDNGHDAVELQEAVLDVLRS